MDTTSKTDLYEEWWRRLEDDKRERAKLRRCNTITDVVMTRAFQELRWEVIRRGEKASIEWLALGAALAAHVRENNSDPLPKRMATIKQGDRPAVSELRFRRLMQTDRDDHDALLRNLRRVLDTVDNKTSISRLFADCRNWNSDSDWVRKKWATEYYQAILDRA